MSRGVRLALGSLAVLVLAAARAGPRVRTGTLHGTCAPWDGPGLALDFDGANRKHPSLFIGIYQDLPRVPFHGPHTVALKSLSGEASLCSGPGRCLDLKSGTVTFDTFDAAGASGHYTLHFAGGKTLDERFRVKRVERHILCG